jgi:methyltransferase (TIGR00027 family)
VRQYVIVGAGRDSFALRRPEFARKLAIFEIDHPATQRFKLDRLAEAGVTPAPPFHPIAVDLAETPLDEALDGSPFDPDRPSFFSWLGVTPYLTREANLATIGAIARCGAPGSELVFTYLDQHVFEHDEWPEQTRRVREAVASVGEPWVSGFDPARLSSELGGVGLELVENLGPEELVARYCAERIDGLMPSVYSYIARARVSR